MTLDEKNLVLEGFLSASDKQTDLLLTLAISVLGGSVALLVQIALHNRNSDVKKFQVKSLWPLLLSFAFLGFSCLVAYLVKGNLSSIRLPLFHATIDPSLSIANQNVPGLSVYRDLSRVHFVSFALGIVFSVVFWTRFALREIGREKS